MSDPKTTAARLRWRKTKAHGFNGVVTYSLSRGGPTLATVQSMGHVKWFWYGGGVNTSDRPASLEECQRQAMEHIRAMEKAA